MCLSVSDIESFDFLACTHILSSELLLSFIDSEATDLSLFLNAGSSAT